MFRVRTRGVLAGVGGLAAVVLALLAGIEPVRALEAAELLRGRTGPQRYICKDQCTLNVGGCNALAPAVNCTGMNVGVVCGTDITVKNSIKFCSPDPSGITPCVNNGSGSCYTQRNCTCAAPVGGVSTCTPMGGAGNPSGAVACAKTQCGANRICQ